MHLARQQTLRPFSGSEKQASRNSAPGTPPGSPQRGRDHSLETLARQRSSYTARAEAGVATESPQEANIAGETAKSAALEPTKRLLLRFSTANIPHPEKRDYGGEDAYFTSAVGGGAFGIADGVGGWQDSGINPAEYSRSFMRQACAYLEGKTVQAVTAQELNRVSGGNSRGQAVTPANASLPDTPPEESAGTAESMRRLTPKGALTTAHSGTRLPGSTTACVMRLDRTTNKLSAANLGDSGFLLVRNGREVFRSPALQHFFDCPLQFAAYPDYTSATDTADDAGIYEVPVKAGDVIVAGTDGLWDNVHQEELISLLPQAGQPLHQVAEDLAGVASKHAHDKKFPSPYSQEAIKQGIDIPWLLKLANASFSDGKFRLGHMKGGKVDDITIVVAYIDEETYTPEQPPADASLAAP